MVNVRDVATVVVSGEGSVSAGTEGTSEAESFLEQVLHLTWRDARLLDTWEESTFIEGLDGSVEAAEQLLVEPCAQNPELPDGYRLRESEWDELSDRIEFPDWGGDRAQIEYVLEGVRPIVERTLLAVYLRPCLEPTAFEAMTSAWRHIVGPVGGHWIESLV